MQPLKDGADCSHITALIDLIRKKLACCSLPRSSSMPMIACVVACSSVQKSGTVLPALGIDVAGCRMFIGHLIAWLALATAQLVQRHRTARSWPETS
jgi:hypothetical protein